MTQCTVIFYGKAKRQLDYFTSRPLVSRHFWEVHMSSFFFKMLQVVKSTEKKGRKRMVTELTIMTHYFRSHRMMSSSYFWVFPAFAVLFASQYMACFGNLLSSIRKTCPNHRRLLSLMVMFTMLSSPWFPHIILRPSNASIFEKSNKMKAIAKRINKKYMNWK